MTDDRNDWFAGIFIALAIGLAIGYVWGHGQSDLRYEEGFDAGQENMMVVVREEVCKL